MVLFMCISLCNRCSLRIFTSITSMSHLCFCYRDVVSRFICKQLQILQHPDIQLSNCKYLAEYFSFLFEFSRMGVEEKRFLRANDCIGIMVTFYVGEPNRANSSSSQVGRFLLHSAALIFAVFNYSL